MQITVNHVQARKAVLHSQSGSPLRRERWAWRVSMIFSPPLVCAVSLLGLAAYLATPEAWGWSLIDMVLIVGLPMLFVAWLVQTGRASDIDLRHRHQRAWPYLVTILTAGVAVGLSFVFGAPRLFTLLIGALMAQTVILAVITRVWKISLHSATVAGAGVVAWHLAGPASLLILALTPLVAWSRIVLRRHDLAQTVAGALVGGLVYSAAFLLIPGV